jgi:SAM-dependent methyltransferase
MVLFSHTKKNKTLKPPLLRTTIVLVLLVLVLLSTPWSNQFPSLLRLEVVEQPLTLSRDQESNDPFLTADGARDLISTSNEKYYDASYQKWQLSSNKFGALYKKRYWRDFLKDHFSCAEFGSSSGYILHSMPCANKIGIEVNNAAREYSVKELGLKAVARTAAIRSETMDFVFTTSVLEHVECPVCELKEIYRILKPGGTLSATVPGMKPASMQWHDNDVNFEFQMFGALELGNLLKAAGFSVDKDLCFSELTQWPPNFEALFAKIGLDAFIEESKKYAQAHEDKYITTWCVGTKEN